MHSFEVHSNESACRKKVRLGLEQVSSKEGPKLPTVLLGAVLITSVIDAYEGIDVEIFDVSGAFLTAYHNEAINITLIGKLANIMVKTLLKYIGNTFTITWHVEDLKSSHINKEVVYKMIEWMKGLYVQEMIVYRGKKHDYLRILLELSVRGQVAVTMVDYIKRVISDFEEV